MPMVQFLKQGMQNLEQGDGDGPRLSAENMCHASVRVAAFIKD